MKITKKDQILQLYKDGYVIEDIISRGFVKKYVTQVLKNYLNSNSSTLSNNKTSISDIKQIISVLEYLQNKSDKVDIKINISINVNTCNTNLDNSLDINAPVLNPIITFRYIGSEGLRKKLMPLNQKDLLKIIKTYTPDINGTIYKEKNINLIIDYIIERSSSLSKVGQVFRTVSKPE